MMHEDYRNGAIICNDCAVAAVNSDGDNTDLVADWETEHGRLVVDIASHDTEPIGICGICLNDLGAMGGAYFAEVLDMVTV